MFDDDAVAALEFLSEAGIVAVDGAAAGSDGALAGPWFVVDDFVGTVNLFLYIFLFFFLLAGLLGDVGRFGRALFEF